MRIIRFEHLGSYRLLVTFADGTQRDCKLRTKGGSVKNVFHGPFQVPLAKGLASDRAASAWNNLGVGRQLPGERYGERSLQKVIKQAADRAGIHRTVTLHMLRHSYATHLMEAGTDIRVIQDLLGYASIKTMEIYTHVTRHTRLADRRHGTLSSEVRLSAQIGSIDATDLRTIGG